MAMMVGYGPGRIQEPRTLSGTPMWVAGGQVFGALSGSQMGSRVGTTRTSVPIWDARIAGAGLTHCAIV